MPHDLGSAFTYLFSSSWSGTYAGTVYFRFCVKACKETPNPSGEMIAATASASFYLLVSFFVVLAGVATHE